MLDWIQFFDRHGIEYVDRGPNVSKNHVVIHCPFCGSDDHSQHLSVNLEGKGWRCFRNPTSHRGKSPVRLIATLLGVSYEQAENLAGNQTYLPDNFMGAIEGLLGNSAKTNAQERELVLPDTFKKFNDQPSSKRFVRYLKEERGLNDIHRLTRQFDLRYCTTGLFAYRVIFPIRSSGKLQTWTGRHIGDNPLRYRTLSTEANPDRPGPVALAPITQSLLWSDQLADCDADTIFLVEGPFDALKIWSLGQSQGIVATCFFTLSASDSQVNQLHELLPRFRRRFLLLDRAALPSALLIHRQLAGLGVVVKQLPDHIKDPGELKSVDDLLRLA